MTADGPAGDAEDIATRAAMLLGWAGSPGGSSVPAAEVAASGRVLMRFASTNPDLFARLRPLFEQGGQS